PILNQHIASLTQAIAALTPTIKSQLQHYNQIQLFKHLQLPLPTILTQIQQIPIYTHINHFKEIQFQIQKKFHLLI
ncbi:3'-5' exonuclease family protein, partial [Staphylococcus epidermidis]|uniref:hypothetical protein n=1 Tax=Staphylococcus epidermidis TaxID=1282 RepID=UPI001C934C10